MHQNVFRFAIISIAFSSCTPSQKPTEVTASANETAAAQPQQLKTVTIKTFTNDTGLHGFGYDIFVDSALVVHQPNIPAVAGNRGFVTEEEAIKIGTYVGNKIKNNIMPPSVTTEELDSLGVR